MSTELITKSYTPYFLTESDWRLMLKWGEDARLSGMLPPSIRSAQAAAIVVLKGRELGVPFMMAISHIHVINGKPSMSAELMQAVALRNIPGLIINILEMSNEKATVQIIRPEKGQQPFEYSFTIEDANKAQLLNKAVWKQYPRAMLFSRAISAALRAKCPDGLMGVSYTPEELDAEVDHEGNVIEVAGRTLNEYEGKLDALTTPSAEAPLSDIDQILSLGTQAGLDKMALKALSQQLYGIEIPSLLPLPDKLSFIAHLEKQVATKNAIQE